MRSVNVISNAAVRQFPFSTKYPLLLIDDSPYAVGVASIIHRPIDFDGEFFHKTETISVCAVVFVRPPLEIIAVVEYNGFLLSLLRKITLALASRGGAGSRRTARA